ncbi:MAG TPA: response regulator, partial [Planctomycetota bacterium]|nr:response regulator [Planctomycetota bacterium]
MRTSEDGDRRRLLIVEDDPDVMAAYRDLLADPRVELEAAGSGLEGLARALAFRPHAIILDVWLPGMDGFDLLRLLRAEPAVRGARVVFVTAQPGAAAADV